MPKQFLLALGLLCFFENQGAAEIIINTLPFWNGTNSICCFAGSTGPNAYGETITAPADSATLSTFTFDIVNSSGLNLPFYAYVSAWSGTAPIGPLLYRSALQSSGSTFAFVTYTFTPDLPVAPGAQYLLFASNDEPDFTAHAGEMGWAYLGTGPQSGEDQYLGGEFRFLPKGVPMSEWASTPWFDPSGYGGHPGDDLAFSVAFTSVPEPRSQACSVLGFACLICLAVLQGGRATRHNPTNGRLSPSHILFPMGPFVPRMERSRNVEPHFIRPVPRVHSTPGLPVPRSRVHSHCWRLALRPWPRRSKPGSTGNGAPHRKTTQGRYPSAGGGGVTAF
jgi:hypothetical protein